MKRFTGMTGWQIAHEGRGSWGKPMVFAAIALLIILCANMYAQGTRVIRRSAHETIFLPDTTGKMDLIYRVDVRATASYTSTRTRKATSIPVDVAKTPNANPLTGGRPWATRLAFSIDEPGEYVVRRTVNSIREGEAEWKAASDSWTVVIGWPHALAPIVVDKEYFPGENPTISFGMRELGDLQGYSWDIRRVDGGAVVDSGRGAVVSFGKHIEVIENVKAQRRFEIRGYYRGRTFSYVAPGDTAVHESIWFFQVKKPELDVATMWEPNAAKAESDLPALPMSLSGPYNPHTFSYTYYGRKGTALILTAAKISNVQMIANPPDFLRSFNPVPTKNQIWMDVTFSPDEGFLALDKGSGQLVELTIVFNTQFETGVRSVFRALVY
jgi:hypothetical protein